MKWMEIIITKIKYNRILGLQTSVLLFSFLILHPYIEERPGGYTVCPPAVMLPGNTIDLMAGTLLWHLIALFLLCFHELFAYFPNILLISKKIRALTN